jgi:hypothetical protein
MRRSGSLVIGDGREALGVAWEALASQKRSFLTLLRVVISTATLISVMSVVHGRNRFVADYVAKRAASRRS